MKIKTFSELISFPSFEERFDYLRLDGSVGETTFGFNRYLNQQFYRSREWKDACRKVILRDQGFDLAHCDHPIFGKVYVHHINPILENYIKEHDVRMLLDPELLISTSLYTHNAIHFGKSNPSSLFIERKPNDTCPWR